MERITRILQHLEPQMEDFDSKCNRRNGASVRKSLQLLKKECHALRREILEKSKTKDTVKHEEPVPPPVLEEPVPPEPVGSHPIPESEPAPVKKVKKKEKKEKKVKKEKKEVKKKRKRKNE